MYHKVKADLILNLKEASVAHQAKMYFKLHIKLKRAVQNIWFNQQCVKNGVIPNYIHIKLNSQDLAARKTEAAAKKIWLKEQTKFWFVTRDALKIYIKVLHSELTFHLHPVEFDLFDDQVRSKISVIAHKIFIKQKQKLQKLLYYKSLSHDNVKSRTNNLIQFYPRTINLSTIEFTTDETKILNKGPKFAPKIVHDKIKETLAIETEIALQNVEDDTDLTKHKICKIIKTFHPPYNTSTMNYSKQLKSLNHKLKNNNLIVTKADKGNSLVILPRPSYLNKVEEFIKKENIVELKTDPTYKYHKEVKNSLLNCHSVLTDKEKFYLTPMNPSAPKLYGLIKTHKNDKPIRPVVSYINSPCRNLAIKLNRLFRTLTKFQDEHSVKNSVDLVHKIKNRIIPSNYKLVSFDVTSMFSNIPPDECLSLIENILLEKHINIVIINEIISLFKVVMYQNYFKFNDKFYSQKEGLAMGSPLSPLLADIFMSNIVNIILNSELSQKHIIFWYRYVDDIFACFNGTERQINNFTSFINNIHPKIKFTNEIEINNSINFLDLTIIKSNNKLNFDIYRKPTTTDTTIPLDSQHPFQQKISAYNSMIHRAFSIPLDKEKFIKELSIIKLIANNNGFKDSMIDQLIENKRKQISLNLVYPKIFNNSSNLPYISMTYFDNISLQISKVLNNNHNINLSFKPFKTLSNFIFNNKDPTNVLDKSGVYKLNCKDCKGIYIGQTGRNFKIRLNEHLRSFRLMKNDSTFANHLLEFKHSPNFELKPLCFAEKGIKLHLLESFYIYKERKNPNCLLLNDQLDLMYTPLFKSCI